MNNQKRICCGLFRTGMILFSSVFVLGTSPGCIEADGGRDEHRTSKEMDHMEQQIETIRSEYPEASIGVSVRELSAGSIEPVLDINGDLEFHAASTMKVPVMIELYRQIELGRMRLDDSLLVENSFSSIVDGSPYQMDIGEDSDESVYSSIGKAMSLRDLTYQMITMSSNLATNLLIDLVSADSVQSTIELLGTSDMKVRRGVEDIKAYDLGLNNTTTSSDLALLLSKIALGETVADAADLEMVEVLRDQRFREMIPAGLPKGTTVAHKTGSITRISHDAAIVSPDEDPFVLVILTKGLAEQERSSELGRRITEVVWNELRGSR